MKKQYINAFLIIMLIVLFTNTDFYKKHVLGIDPELIKNNKTSKVVEASKTLEEKDETSTNQEGEVVKESDLKKDTVKDLDSIKTLALTDTTLDSATLASIIAKDLKPVLTEKKIKVNTKTHSLVFSSKGAVIEGVTLNGFKTLTDSVINLFDKGSINSLKVNKFLDTESIYTVNLTDSVYNFTTVDSLKFVYENKDFKIEKTYIIDPEKYDIEVKLSINNSSNINSYTINWDSPINFNDREDKNEANIVSMINDEYEINRDEELAYSFSNVDYFWVGYRTKYFWGSMLFNQTSELEGKVFAKTNINSTKTGVNGYYHNKFTPAGDVNSVTVSYKIIVSPIDGKVLSPYGYELDKVAKYGFTIIHPISSLLMKILLIMNKFISNWGIIIILFSILLKTVLYPLNKKTIESGKEMQAIQPLVAEINKKYAKDPQRKQIEMMNLYKQHKINPLGGCLPMLIQMPFFFAMYAVFRGAIEFRQAPFFGWITDLSQPESIFSIPLFGFEFHLGILVVIASVTMFIQMKMTMKDPKQKQMPYIMCVMMFFIFSTMSAGLNLYMATFNIYQLVQQFIVEKAKKA